jgi:hypothetical protein
MHVFNGLVTNDVKRIAWHRIFVSIIISMTTTYLLLKLYAIKRHMNEDMVYRIIEMIQFVFLDTFNIATLFMDPGDFLISVQTCAPIIVIFINDMVLNGRVGRRTLLKGIVITIIASRLDPSAILSRSFIKIALDHDTSGSFHQAIDFATTCFGMTSSVQFIMDQSKQLLVQSISLLSYIQVEHCRQIVQESRRLYTMDNGSFIEMIAKAKDFHNK